MKASGEAHTPATHRATRCGRISNIAGFVAYMGLLMLAFHLIDLLSLWDFPPVLGPLGAIVTLIGGVTSMAAEQLADRYREAA